MKTRLNVRSRVLLAVVTLVALAAVLAACGGSSGASSTPAATAPSGPTANVSIANLTYTPKTLTVSSGTTVVWTNNDTVPHNVVSAVSISVTSATTSLFASSTLSQGQTFSFTFAKKGVYFYECTIHKALPTMHAEVIVK